MLRRWSLGSSGSAEERKAEKKGTHAAFVRMVTFLSVTDSGESLDEVQPPVLGGRHEG